MVEKETLKDKMIRGDYAALSEVTGYNKEYIQQIFAGTRNNDTVIDAAWAVIETREALKAQFHRSNKSKSGKHI